MTDRAKEIFEKVKERLPAEIQCGFVAKNNKPVNIYLYVSLADFDWDATKLFLVRKDLLNHWISCEIPDDAVDALEWVIDAPATKTDNPLGHRTTIALRAVLR